MSNSNLQLTISLLISDRLDTIPRCLDSLRPILEAIPSELILIDTSKNPKVNALLKTYTDKVYEFEWCNDFAKARNEGVKRARGEWFMFLDDDEWFVEVQPIIDFFQSGEYKEYNLAHYRIRNFEDVEYTIYSDGWVSRMAKLEEDSRFVGKIHEYFGHVQGKEKYIEAMAYHSGYIFDTEEKITNDAINHSSAKKIPKGSILMAMYGATIGKLGIAAKELTCNQACCVFDLSNVSYITSYLFCWLKENRDFFISQGKGAAQPNLSQAMIKNFDIIIPTDNLLMAFSKISDKMLEKSANLQMQNIGLMETRDRLLPKLMSGELEV